MKFNIAICDDNKSYLRLLKEYVANVMSQNNIVYELFCCYNGMELLQYCKQNTTDIVLVDIEMPVMDGFSAIEKLQKLQPQVFVIFVTSHDELAIQSYDYQPFWFVRKDNLSKIEHVLTRCIKRILKKRNEIKEICKLHTGDEIVEIDCLEVIYLESNKHYLNICGELGEERKIRCSMETAYQQLKNFGFIKVQRSYIVNCRYISRLSAQNVKLKDGRKITVTRNKEVLKEIQEVYRAFMREQRC